MKKEILISRRSIIKEGLSRSLIVDSIVDSLAPGGQKITSYLQFHLHEVMLEYSTPTWATVIAGAFVLLTLTLSIYLLFEHLSAYKDPEEQKFLIGVILMVPCYAIESFISLVNPSISVDIEILRDCYESFAMYCFGRYLIACLGGEERAIEFMEREGRSSIKAPLLEPGSDKGTLKHPFPMNYFLKPWKLVILEALNVYCEGDFKLTCGIGYEDYLSRRGLLSHGERDKTIPPNRYPYMAVVLNFSLSIHPVQMGIASVVHLYVFPSKPYELMGDRIPGSVAVLGDYASVDCPLDPDEVRDSERPTKLRLPQPESDNVRSGMTIRESVRDVFVGGGEYIVNDLKFTVTHAVEPMEKGITKFNQKLHKISENIKKDRRTKDDSCVATSSSPQQRVIRGIDDPLLNGSVSDTGGFKKKKHRRKSGYTSESGGESSGDQSLGGFEIGGRRWVTKD
ncbi:hypothetical protein LguiA_021947 [Lonicera macranthoides]